MSPEVGLRGFLSGFHDPSSDAPRPGEKLFQFVTLAPANGAGQRLQVFGEATEDFQHSVITAQNPARAAALTKITPAR